VDNVESWSDGLDKIAHVGSNWVVSAVENVDEDRPGVELLNGCLWRGWESHIRGCESLGIREGQGSTRLSYFRLLDHELDSLGLRVAFTHTQANGERPSLKEMPVQAGLKDRKTWSVILVAAKGRQPADKVLF
jgi:hypothetical protein